VTISLAETRLYLVAGAELRAGRLADLVPELADAGVDLIQLREKEMEAGDLLRVAPPVLEACRQAGIPFVLNDRPDVATVVGADGVHVGQNDLPVEATRHLFGSGIVGLSTHAEHEVDDALQGDATYFAVGPVYETPTKLGRPAAGLELVRYAAGRAPASRPWFAIGGIASGNLEEVMEAGARRIVVVRAITEAEDPPGATAALKGLLDAAPL
jgi:thiamine-phosphate pyrophosphorylase